MNRATYKNYLNPRHLNFWIAAIIIAGFILRSVQYFGATSLWLDEVTSALNIQSRNFAQLATEKLEFNQVAPLGFLWTSKIAALLFGEEDLAYRFVPWLWSLLSVPLFYFVAKRFLHRFYLLAAVALFSFSYSGFLYAGQAKQYAGDLAISLFFVWTAFLFTEEHLSKSMQWLIGLLGFVGILSSFQATPIFFFIAAVIMYQFYSKKITIKRQVWITGFVWLVAVCISVWYALSMNSQVKADMGAYWKKGFPPANFGMDYILWYPKKLYEEVNFFLAWWLADLLPAIRIVGLLLLLATAPGLIYLSKQKGYITLFLFAPLIAALLLAAAYQYPFANRVGLYATFPILISAMAGLQALQSWWPKFIRPGVASAIAFVLGFIPILHLVFAPLLRPPYLGQPMQPVLKELKKQMQPGDILYVYHKAKWAVQFYGAREGITDYIVAKGDTTVIPILRDADKLKGNKRVWFLYTQWTPPQPFPDSIKAYLGTVIGKEIGRIPDPYGGTEDLEAAAYLYDLSAVK
jgi:hypothetical protein